MNTPRQLRCPSCGEEDDLRGQRAQDGIRITCGACGTTWLRDSTPLCATCGGDQIVHRPRTMTQYSRGTQLSVVGWQDVPLCLTCDADAIARSTSSGGPLPAGYQSAAVHVPRTPIT